jgi:hypothetical protein
LHKSFGGLFDEIIMLMMVNYLIMWKSVDWYLHLRTWENKKYIE